MDTSEEHFPKISKLAPWITLLIFSILLFLVFLVYRSFLVAIFTAAIFFILFRTPHDYLTKRLQGRITLSSVIISVLILPVIFFPASYIVFNLAKEVVLAIEKFSGWAEAEKINELYLSMPWIHQWVAPSDISLVRNSLIPLLQEYGLTILAQSRLLVLDLLRLASNLLLSVILLFFLLRNGAHLAEMAYQNIPIHSQLKRQIGKRMLAVFDAVVKGNLLIAIAQGVVLGALFALFNLPTPILYGTTGMFFGLIPVLGTNVLWVPAAIYLYLHGSTGPAILFGALSFSSYLILENIAKPLLMDKELDLHPMALLLALLGGLGEFGLKGLILGPFIVTVFISLWQMIKLWNEKNENTA